MNSSPEVVLVGRSSSHFTRTARIFALELGVAHAFRPVLDLTATAPARYADNPALKVPVLVDEQGSLFGTENICRELARRSGQRQRVVLRGDASHRLLANAEEMVLHAMSNGVTLIMLGVGATADAAPLPPPPPKVRRSLEHALEFLDENVEAARAALPADRLISFFETSLYCLTTHLPFRNIMGVGGYARLRVFCDEFGQRAGARATPYRFDAA
jgi:glutathione S-transferase